VNATPPLDSTRLAALRAGDDAALAALVSEMQAPLYGFAWRYLHNSADAEELVIETFIRLEHARRRLRAETNLNAWLFTTLANLCHNRHRWRTRHPETSLEAPAGTPAPEYPAAARAPDRALEHDETVAALRAAIDTLSHEHRTVVLLHHYDHLSYREIGVVVGCSERGVETRLYRARQQLRTKLAALLHEHLAS
jgi:RNA polymerase sigma-70 factor (ECF subfamily)